MRVVAALALVAALLVAFILLADRHPPGGADRRANRLRLVGAFDRASVRRLVITRRGEAPFSLLRQAPGQDPAWRLDPGGRAAAGGAVEDLLAAIDFAETERTADLTPAAAGLAPPTVTLDLDTGVAPLSLKLGRVDAGGGGVFVGVGSEASIRVGPRHLRDLAERGAGAYLDPSGGAIESARGSDNPLVASPPEAVTRIEIVDGARRLVLDRIWGRPWHFEFPKVSYGTDARAIADWLTAAGRTGVTPASPGANARRLRIDAGTREVTQVPPSSSSAYALLDPDPLRFRDRTVLDFAHFDARRVRRTSGASIAEIASDDGDTWRVTSPPEAVLDRAHVPRVVAALAGLRCETFASARPAGPPELTLEILVATPGAPSPVQHAVEIFAAQRSRCTGRLDGATVFSLTSAVCDDLRLTLVANGG